MVDLRRVAIIFVIAILYTVLVNAIIGAFYLEPRQEDYCRSKFYPERPYPAADAKIQCPKYNEPTQDQLDDCANQKGMPEYTYNANGCPTAYKGCNFCQKELDNASQKYNFIVFIISSILALIAIGLGILLPVRNSLNEWIATGFMLGGLITLFVGTFRYYQYLGRYVKPVVILVELLIVIYLSYKKLQDSKPGKSGKKK